MEHNIEILNHKSLKNILEYSRGTWLHFTSGRVEVQMTDCCVSELLP